MLPRVFKTGFSLFLFLFLTDFVPSNQSVMESLIFACSLLSAIFMTLSQLYAEMAVYLGSLMGDGLRVTGVVGEQKIGWKREKGRKTVELPTEENKAQIRGPEKLSSLLRTQALLLCSH